MLLAASSDGDYGQARSWIARGRLEKWYLALVTGELRSPRTIDIALARRRSRVVAARRRDRPLPARTDVRPLDVGRGWSLVEAYSRSGAPHQIRVHLSLIGHPLIGDRVYGGPPARARPGQLLHALRVRLADAADVCAPIPADFIAAYALLRKGSLG
ncbi:MAG: RNA pseudouridine synthase [Deltaproteobacteria bacterium]|nr:MAG: RNA pseudouridine synthase [Deltaproteobacteria bacterium]